MEGFQDRVAVITGGAAGIGLALARALAERGSHLVLADIDEEALAGAEKELSGAGSRVLGVRTDVRERSSVEALAEASFAEFGRVHLVVNNAGIAPLGRMIDAEPEDWEIAMAVNFWGVVHGVHAFLPHLVENDDGHIVNTASMAGLVGLEGFGIYCASKFAVVGLTESLFRELKGSGVSASVLCPMIVQTNLGHSSRRILEGRRSAPPVTGSTSEQMMAGNVISPEEVAARVLRGIERKDLYILTHPEQREILRRRAARQDAMFADDLWPL